jgi:hypothetical protein
MESSAGTSELLFFEMSFEQWFHDYKDDPEKAAHYFRNNFVLTSKFVKWLWEHLMVTE